MYQDGTIKNGNAIIVKGQKITLQILSKLVSSLPGGATISTVLNYINTMTGSNQNISLGSDAIGLSSNLTVAAGIQLTGAEAIMKDTNAGGHLLKTQAVLSYYGSTSGSVNTIGAIKVDFTKYDVEDTFSVSGSTSMQLNYKASNP